MGSVCHTCKCYNPEACPTVQVYYSIDLKAGNGMGMSGGCSGFCAYFAQLWCQCFTWAACSHPGAVWGNPVGRVPPSVRNPGSLCSPVDSGWEGSEPLVTTL